MRLRTPKGDPVFLVSVICWSPKLLVNTTPSNTFSLLPSSPLPLVTQDLGNAHWSCLMNLGLVPVTMAAVGSREQQASCPEVSVSQHPRNPVLTFFLSPLLRCSLSHQGQLYVLRQSISLNLKLTSFPKMVNQQDPKILGSPPSQSGITDERYAQFLPWALGRWTQVLMFDCQALYWLSHFSSLPTKHFLTESTGINTVIQSDRPWFQLAGLSSHPKLHSLHPSIIVTDNSILCI